VPPLPDVPSLPDMPPHGAIPTPPPVPSPPEVALPEAPAGETPAPPAFEPPLDATIISRPEPHEELVIVHDNQRTPIEGAIVQIGRAPGCDIVLDDRNVSRRHAEIRRRGPVVVLIDLDSTNGTIVNGRRVREHPLADGDRITLGNSRLTFERRTTT
jgi:pSer/pThr/pTyr-binding forkhead associated (FHA) protein